MKSPPAGEYQGLEACYDASGNMVALYRLELSDCAAEPLSESSADWTCAGPTRTPAFRSARAKWTMFSARS